MSQRIEITQATGGAPAGSCGVIQHRQDGGMLLLKIDRTPECEILSPPLNVGPIHESTVRPCHCR